MIFFYADMCPKNASYYGNRAATLMMLCRYREALEDCQQAVRLDNSFIKASCGKETTILYQGGMLALLTFYNVCNPFSSLNGAWF